MTQYKTIAESNNYIVLDSYKKAPVLTEVAAVYQSESALEREFIADLVSQGYDNPKNITTQEAMLACFLLDLMHPHSIRYL